MFNTDENELKDKFCKIIIIDKTVTFYLPYQTTIP